MTTQFLLGVLFIYDLCRLSASRFGITDLICHLDYFLLLQGFLRHLRGRLASFHSENPIYIANDQGCKCWKLRGQYRRKGRKGARKSNQIILEYRMSSGLFLFSNTDNQHINSSLFPFSKKSVHVHTWQYGTNIKK